MLVASPYGFLNYTTEQGEEDCDTDTKTHIQINKIEDRIQN